MKSLLVIFLLVATIFTSGTERFSSAANPVTLTLNQAVCLALPNGQTNSTSAWILNSNCAISVSIKQSPFFLTNSTTTLIVPSGITLTLNSGFGVANYGTLNNSGTLTQHIAFINYGQILNYHTWNVQSTFVQMNTTGANVLSSGFTTNQPTGTITISSGIGFFYNGNRVINNGVISNSGHVCKFLPGYGTNGTFSGNAITGNAINC